jgi:glycosyltransferase involved in cell wall biosynthesis
MSPDISIVVCTQNRAAMLRGALASLYDLITDDFAYETVVIDNGSTDETQQVIAAAAAKSRHPLRGAYEAEKGIVPARNRGIREAQGRWIAFFDDDQLADSRWLAELRRGTTLKKCRIVGGSVHLKFLQPCTRHLDPTVRMLLGEAKYDKQPVLYGGQLTPGCGNLMIERGVFDQVGAFRRTVSGRGEDTDLFSRIERAGIAGWYLPLAIVHHLTPPERLKVEYLLSLAHRMGEGIALRQFQHLGRGRFAALWLAKAARLAVAQAPWAAVWGCCGHHEAWLGRRCLVGINASFLRAGRSLIFSRNAESPNKKPSATHGAALVHPRKSVPT